MIQKQRELQQMRQSIAELKQLQLSVQQLLDAEPPAPAGGLASRPHTDPTPPAAAPPPAAAETLARLGGRGEAPLLKHAPQRRQQRLPVHVRR